MDKSKKLFFIVFLTFVLIFFDQILKYSIRHSGGFYICNENIAFGIAIPEFVFWPLMGVIILLLTLAFKKCFMPICVSGGGGTALNRINPLYLVMILAGTLSNLADRLFFGCVIDFIDLKFWPIFNLADVMIVAGAVLLIIQSLNFKVRN
jgi:lipoprotein signal peptidase